MDYGIVRSGSADIYYERHGESGEYLVPVSYTHLTLPTILLV